MPVVDCGSLASPANGQVSLTTTTFGSTATYECDAGYVLVGGEETRTCQENGQWSGTAPTCNSKSSVCFSGKSSIVDACILTVVDCGSLASPTNGQVSLTTTTFGSTATYECDTGFNLIGDMERTCQENGQWTGGAPTCEGILINISIHILTRLEW